MVAHERRKRKVPKKLVKLERRIAAHSTTRSPRASLGGRKNKFEDKSQPVLSVHSSLPRVTKSKIPKKTPSVCKRLYEMAP